MSDIKMSETFHRNGINSFCGDISENGMNIFTGGCKYKADAIVVAVNSHDKLTEQTKLLREALNIMVEYAEVCDKVLGSTIGSFERGTAIPMAKDLLEQTK